MPLSTFEQILQALAIQTGHDVKSLNDRLGLNANLTTQTKTTLVAAINEIVSNIGNIADLKKAASYTAPSSFLLAGLEKTLVLTDSDEAGAIKYYGYKAADDSVWGIVRFDSTSVNAGVVGTLNSILTTDSATYGVYSAMWTNRATFTTQWGGAMNGEDAGFMAGVAYTNLVDAIIDALDAGNIALALIDDTAGDGITNKTWSANKIYDYVLTQIQNVVGAAPEVLNQISEISAALNDDPNFAVHVAEALALRVRVDAAQNFTNTQKQQGRDNIGAAAQSDLATTNQNLATLNANLGDVTHNFLTDYTNARDGVVQ
jgi:hypothetical protein